MHFHARKNVKYVTEICQKKKTTTKMNSLGYKNRFIAHLALNRRHRQKYASPITSHP